MKYLPKDFVKFIFESYDTKYTKITNDQIKIICYRDYENKDGK